MDFTLNTEQQEIAAVVGAFVDEVGSDRDLRVAIDSPLGYDPTVWGRMGADLGLTGLLVPESFGGLGLSSVDVAIVAEQLGRALVPSPFLASAVFAVSALRASKDVEAMSRWLPDLASGAAIGTVCLQEVPYDYRCINPSTSATRRDGRFSLGGVKRFVLDAPSADLLLVLANEPEGTSLFVVDPASTGVEIRPQESLDPTSRLATVVLDGAPADRVGAPGSGRLSADRALDSTIVALSAESVGGAARCLEMAVDYAKDRQQFGRPIGSFQAIQHKCAEVYVQLELARTALWFGAWALGTGDRQAPEAVSTSKVETSRAFALAASENVQIHGGIGFTWEHPAHWYVKRSRSYERLFGSEREHYRRIEVPVAP